MQYDIRGLTGLVRRQHRFVIASAVLAILCATLWLQFTTPMYSSAAMVLVQPSVNLLETQAAAAVAEPVTLARVDSEAELIRSNATLARLAEDMNILGDPDFAKRPSPLDFLLGQSRVDGQATTVPDIIPDLRSRFSVKRVGATQLISVQASASNPQRAAELANALVAAYLDEQLKAKVASSLQSRDMLQQRLSAASGAVATAEGSFDSFLTQSLGDVVEYNGRTEFVDLRGEVLAKVADRASIIGQMQSARNAMSTRDWQQAAQVLSNTDLAVLAEHRRAVVNRLEGVLPEADRTAANSELQALDQQLQAGVVADVQKLQQQAVEAQVAISDLRQSLRNEILSSDLPTDILVRIFEIQQQSNLARTQYQNTAERLADVEAQASMQMPDARLVSSAVPPNAPSFPNVTQVLVLAILGGVALGFILALLHERSVGGLLNSEQAHAALSTSILANVPLVSRGRFISRPADQLVYEPASPFAEAIRRVRSGLEALTRKQHDITDASAKARRGVVVVVTSATAGEGKSTLALALGRSYAIAGASTVLIDADFHRPSIHKMVGMEAAPGLVDYLRRSNSRSSPESFLQIDHLSGLKVMAGSVSADLVEPLAVDITFRKLIADAASRHDMVIVNALPMNPTVDALYAVRQADAVVMVVKWAGTSRRLVREALNLIEGASPTRRPIVSVLNKVEGPLEGYQTITREREVS